MFKFAAVFVALCLVTYTNAGFLPAAHYVHEEPVLAKVGAVVHSAPSAVSHQSITQVHSTPVVQPILAPVVKTTVHAVPLVHAAPVVHAAPIVHSAPLVHSVPVVHSAPLVKSIVASPLAYSLHH